MRKLLFALIVILLFGCDEDPHQLELNMLADAPYAGESTCKWKEAAAFNLSIGKWEKDELHYFIQNWPVNVPSDVIREDIRYSVGLYEDTMEIPIYEVDNIEEADVLIKFDFMDGRGGTHGLSYFPPINEASLYPVPITIDKYDIVAERIEGLPSTRQILIHEFGHAFGGLRHSNHIDAMMYPSYLRDMEELFIDDMLGIKEKYERKTSFFWKGRCFMYIPADKPIEITRDFRLDEFKSKCRWYEGKGHFIDQNLIWSVQYIRSKYNTPIRILSTARDYDCNIALKNASKNSQHLVNMALDWKFVGPKAEKANARFQRDIIAQRQVFRTLLGYNIRGFGGYKTSNHIDTRESGALTYNDIKYATWGTLNGNAYVSNEDFCGEDL